MKIYNYSKSIFTPDKINIFIVFCVLILAAQELFAAPGRIDLKFPQLLSNGANVTAIATQTDGKILIAGEFKTRGMVLRNDLIRLNADGTLDTTFNIGSGLESPNIIRFIKLQTDGKILIAGYMNQINETSVRSIARLNSNGSIDTTFNLSGIDVVFVQSLDIQTDGKILISAMNLGGFQFVTRLKTDGSNDQGIGQPLYVAGSSNYTVTFVPTDNKILVGGRSLVRLNLDGTIDSTFTATITYSAFEISINTKLLVSGKILVYGKFDTVNGAARGNIAVLNSNGSLDTAFNPATTGAEIINDAVEQTDGKIIIGGTNFPLNSRLRGNVARLNADGTIDRTFNQGRGANGDVNALKILSGSKMLIGGNFFRYHIFPRSGLAQVNL